MVRKKQALPALVEKLIDYAGLFPPASLPMQTVVSNFRDYYDGPYRSVLGRLIVPAGRLEEFESLSAHLLPDATGDKPWRISSLLPAVDAPDAGYDAALLAIESFNERHRAAQNGRAVVDAVEVRIANLQQIDEAATQIPENLDAFLEIPHDVDPAAWVEKISAQPRTTFAKIRTGGVTQDAIPSIDEVARFIARCVEHQVGFKATAGLHHPIRGEARLTYERDSPTAVMHGFVNVFVASVLAVGHSLPVPTIAAILGTCDPDAFHIDTDQITWQDLSVTAAEISKLRQTTAISFGSCSFTEPTVELESLKFADSLSV